MRLNKSLMISAIAVVGVLALSGCNDSAEPEAEDTAVPEEVIEFEAGTTMAAGRVAWRRVLPVVIVRGGRSPGRGRRPLDRLADNVDELRQAGPSPGC